MPELWGIGGFLNLVLDAQTMIDNLKLKGFLIFLSERKPPEN